MHGKLIRTDSTQIKPYNSISIEESKNLYVRVQLRFVHRTMFVNPHKIPCHSANRSNLIHIFVI